MSLLPISIYPIESKPFGLTYSEWTVKWWQWLLSIPKSQNPAFDDTGAFAKMQQDDPNIFFLCQTIEPRGKVPLRTVDLPANKSIFMPIINWISIDEEGETEEELTMEAKKKIDVATDLRLTIDDVTIEDELKKYRASSPAFTTILPEDNVLDSKPGKHLCVSDGYWLFFKPLKKIAKLSSYGACSARVTRMGIDYNLANKLEQY